MRLITESGYADEAYLCRDCTSIASILLPVGVTGNTPDSESGIPGSNPGRASILEAI